MRFQIILLAFLVGNAFMSAQTFTDRLRRQNANEGSIIIYQESYLTRLLNGKSSEAVNTQKGTGKKDTSNNVALSKSSKNQKQTNGNTQTPSHANNRFTVVKEADTSVISDNPAQKKIYKNSITTYGYRIRLYVGGSSREARQKAYSVGYLFKSVYMDIPVYTHFYSPHWMCSAGNFKTYEEASRFLAELKTTGQFGGAMIVKSKIQIEQ